MQDFFVSYSQLDHEWAVWIAWQLEESGHTTVIQAWDFRPGSNFVLEMKQATETCRRTVAVLSPAYLKSVFAQAEWAAGFAQDPTGELGTLIPVRVHHCELEGLLSPVVYIDLVDKDEKAARNALLNGIDLAREKPESPPYFPGDRTNKLIQLDDLSTQCPRYPGALPPIHNTFPRRNPAFIGRQQSLRTLRDALVKGESVLGESHPHAIIHGLGGIGKTQLALEYIYRHAADYDVAWWIRCDQRPTSVADLSALAKPLELSEKDEPDRQIVLEAVRRWLESNDRWLLVFDNVVNVDNLYELLPPAFPGHVIATSRNRHWPGRGSSLELTVFSRDTSVDYLVTNTRSQQPSSRSETTPHDPIYIYAAELAEELGDLPLALAEAVGYISETGDSVADYLDLFRANRRRLCARRVHGADDARAPGGPSVALPVASDRGVCGLAKRERDR